MTSDNNKDIFDYGFDHNLNRKGSQEVQNQNFEQRTRKNNEEQEKMERIRTQRIIFSGKNLLVYAIDKLIDKSIVNSDRFQISAYDLGFESAPEAHGFINKLQKEDCFEKIDRSDSTFTVLKPNIENIKKSKEKIEKIISNDTGIIQEKDKQKNKTSIFFKNIPLDTKWEDIEISFKNIYDIEIKVKGKFLKNSNCVEMGLYDKKTKDKKPDKQWKFLQTLSTCNGKFDLKQFSVIKEKDKYRQYKKNLSKTLQKLFGIDEDPFDEENGTYQTKFKIKPEPDLRGSGEIWNIKNKNEEIQKFIYDEIDKKAENHKINTHSKD